jgi:hypothetical protein
MILVQRGTEGHIHKEGKCHSTFQKSKAKSKRDFLFGANFMVVTLKSLFVYIVLFHQDRVQYIESVGSVQLE